MKQTKRKKISLTLILSFICLTSCSSDPHDILNTAKKHAKNNEWEKTIEQLDKIIDQKKENPDIAALYAIALNNSNQSSKAFEFIKNAIEHNKNNISYYHILTDIYFNLNEYDNAISLVNQLLKDAPITKKNFNLLCLYFQCLNKTNKRDDEIFMKRLRSLKNYAKESSNKEQEQIYNLIAVYLAKEKTKLPNSANYINKSYKTTKTPTNILNMAIIADLRNDVPLAKNKYNEYLKVSQDQDLRTRVVKRLQILN